MVSTDNELNAEYRLYCLNVGNLFTEFARLENLLTSALKLHLAFNIGSPEDVSAMRLASAIYGSMRFKASRDTIKRLFEVEDSPKLRVQFVENIFAQVGHIEAIRDKIAHQMVMPAHSDLGAFWQVSDMVTTRNIQQVKVWVFNTDAVFAAAKDLNTIGDILGKRPITNKLFDHLAEFALPSWRYKPSMLKLVPHSKLKIPPTQ